MQSGTEDVNLFKLHEERIVRVENQVVGLHGQFSDLKSTVTKIEADMSYNNKVTDQIKSDTAEMVIATKGMRFLGKVLAFCAVIGTIVVSVQTIIGSFF